MSPIWGCAHEAEQPEKCILTASWPMSPTRSSISLAHSAARILVSTIPNRQNSLPVQATTPRSNAPGFGRVLLQQRLGEQVVQFLFGNAGDDEVLVGRQADLTVPVLLREPGQPRRSSRRPSGRRLR